MSKQVHLFGVMHRRVGNFRQHTIVLAKALSVYHNVTIVSDRHYRLSRVEMRFIDRTNIDFTDVNSLHTLAKADRVLRIYQLANGNPHEFILDEFMKLSGIVLLHDVSLYWLLSGYEHTCDIFLARELGIIHGGLALKALDWDVYPDTASQFAHAVYFNRIVGEKAAGIITHSGYMKNLLSEKFPETPIRHLPLMLNTTEPIKIHDDKEVNRIRRRLGIGKEKVVFGIFGYMAKHKRILEILNAFLKASEEDSGFQVLLCGKWDPLLRSLCSYTISALRLRGCIKIRNKYLKRNKLLSYMQVCDYMVNLRYPTAGESSGVAVEANTLGIPVIFNNYAGFSDLERNKKNIAINVLDTTGVLRDSILNVIREKRTTARDVQSIYDKISQAEMRYANDINSIVDDFSKLYRDRVREKQYCRQIENVRLSQAGGIRFTNPDDIITTLAVFILDGDTIRECSRAPYLSPLSLGEFIYKNGINPHLVEAKNYTKLWGANVDLFLTDKVDRDGKPIGINENVSSGSILLDVYVVDTSINGLTLLKKILCFLGMMPLGGSLFLSEQQGYSLMNLVKDPFEERCALHRSVRENYLQTVKGEEEAEMIFGALGLKIRGEIDLGHSKVSYYVKETNVIDKLFLDVI